MREVVVQVQKERGVRPVGVRAGESPRVVSPELAAREAARQLTCREARLLVYPLVDTRHLRSVASSHCNVPLRTGTSAGAASLNRPCARSSSAATAAPTCSSRARCRSRHLRRARCWSTSRRSASTTATSTSDRGGYGSPPPAIIGAEGAGTVTETGERVAWSNVAGSYAERVAAPRDKLVPVPGRGIDRGGGSGAAAGDDRALPRVRLVPGRSRRLGPGACSRRRGRAAADADRKASRRPCDRHDVVGGEGGAGASSRSRRGDRLRRVRRACSRDHRRRRRRRRLRRRRPGDLPRRG